MDVVENEQLTEKQATEHWYYHAKYCMIKKHILDLFVSLSQISIADVGTGIGLFLKKLEKEGLASPNRSIGIDPAHETPSTAVGSLIPIVPYFPSGSSYDLVLMMDVLEHVENDLALINNTAEHIRQNGYLLITVPALPFLMSSHDRFLGHYRRYTINSLRDVINKSENIRVMKLHYFFAGILPIAIPKRLYNKNKSGVTSDMKPLSKNLNFILKALCSIELKISSYNRIAGLSAVAVCKKI